MMTEIGYLNNPTPPDDNYSAFMDQCRQDIEDGLMTDRFVKCGFVGGDFPLTWDDFIEYVDDGEMWDELRDSRWEVMRKFCDEYAENRARYIEKGGAVVMTPLIATFILAIAVLVAIDHEIYCRRM